MDTHDGVKKFGAGLFLVVGIVAIVAAVFIIGKDKGLSRAHTRMTVVYRNIGGLLEGAPVRLSGVTVGSVAAINFLDVPVNGRRVAVQVVIFDSFAKQLHGNLRFAIKTEGILGEKLIEIYSAESEGNTDLSQPVIGEDPLDVQDMAVVFADAAASFTKTSQALGSIDIKELTEVMEESSRALLTTADGVNEVVDELTGLTIKSKRLFDRVEQRIIDGTLFKVF
jgi:ABC-type transporter Mla subunit MlaD